MPPAMHMVYTWFYLKYGCLDVNWINDRSYGDKNCYEESIIQTSVMVYT